MSALKLLSEGTTAQDFEIANFLIYLMKIIKYMNYIMTVMVITMGRLI